MAGPDYAAVSDGDHFAAFCETTLQHSIDEFAGKPVVLEDWQRRFMDEALAYDDTGAPCWQSVALVLPRKSGKTTMLAAYALYRVLYDNGSPEILLAAASDRQAGRLFDSVAAFVRRSPALMDVLTVRGYQGEIARKDGEGRILRMSSSPERLHGYNPSLVICDEVAQWTTPSLRRAWAALTTGGGARSRAQTFSISTAGEGHQRQSSILGRLIDGNEADGDVESIGALNVSRNEAARTLVYNYSARTTDPSDIAAIKAANPASWITEEYLARQAANPELSDAEFLQLHACVWSDADTAWITRDTWSTCATGESLADGDVVCLGFDGSMFDDATALVASRLDDGLIEVLGVWQRPDGAAGTDWEVPRNEVDAAMFRAMDTYAVLRAYCDPPFWQSEIERWAVDFGDVIVPWFTNRDRAMGAALERFRTDTQTGELKHNGDKRLAEHVGNARVAETRSGYRIEKPGRRSNEKIDLAMAAVLAYEARCDAIAAGDRVRGKRAVFI